MKTRTLALALSFAWLASCSSGAGEITADNFDWLVGEWNSTNEEPGMSTSETWVKLNDSTYAAHSFTLQGQDTIWQETTRLSPVDGHWHFQVTPVDKPETTNFRMISADNASFACENKANEFPKLIKYRKKGEQLLAEISGGGNKVKFVFGKK
ncbi:MAG: hypothetical protein KIT80_14130 [Chitinophagaceae bacterium]|nr:hypothetical protein [Chitinophagaceae bacterium]MCW5928050.1 hypothetical protein [Chitinophagaceae bacterium]